MAAEAPSRPGIQVGPTSEFSLFFHVKPGHGEALRRGPACAAGLPWLPARRLRPADRGHPRGPFRAVRRRHPAALRHQLRRLLGRLHGGLRVQAAAAVRRHLPARRGLRGPARPGGGQELHPVGAQVTAGGYARNYGGTVKEIRKAERVNKAFQQVLDDPEAAEAAAGTRPWPRCSPRRPTERRTVEETGMSDHISGPRALAEPIADITDVYAFPSPETTGRPGPGHQHPAVRTARRPLLRRADLPVPAPAAHAGRRAARIGAVRRRAPRSWSSTASSPTSPPRRARSPASAAHRPATRSPSASATPREAKARGYGSSPAPAGTRSSSTPRRR